MSLRSEEVFTPNGFPKHTYVARNNNESEDELTLVLRTVGFVSVAGPSKSGKTVLVEKVLGPDGLVTVAGGNVHTTNDLWASVVSQLGEPQSVTHSDGAIKGEKVTVGMKAGAIVEAKGELLLNNDRTTGEAKTYAYKAFEQACSVLRSRKITLLVDDFHYIPKDVQRELAKQFKEITRETATQRRVQVVLAAVPHRADDPVRANSDLSGRIGTVDLVYWNIEELLEIAQKGFLALNVELPNLLLQKMAQQAAGSPQLMQTLCFTLATRVLKVDQTLPSPQRFGPTDSQIESVLKAVARVNDSRSLVGKLDAGKKTRGVERILYDFRENAPPGDVYTCILRALALDPPVLDFASPELEARIQRVCKNKTPPWHSVALTLNRMQEIADAVPSNAFVWDGEQLELTDPHVLFYLRWCGDYREPRMRIHEAPPIRRPKKG